MTTLVIVDCEPDGRDLSLTFRNAFGRTLHTRGASLAELDALGLHRELQRVDAVAQRFVGVRGSALGHELCRWLFGGPGDQARLLRALDVPGDAPTVRSTTLRVELRADHPLLLVQPWHLLSWQHARLLGDGWSVWITPRRLDSSRARATLCWPPSVLAVVPALGHATDNIDAAPHVDALRDLLQSVGCPGGALELVATRGQLDAALDEARARGRGWDVLYFYGHGRVRDGGAELLMGDAHDGDVAPVSVRALAERQGSALATVTYLNCCSVGGGGWLGAGNLLCREGAVVLSHLCPVAPRRARARAHHFFTRLLQHGDDPLTSFTPRPDELGRGDEAPRDDDPEWMCGVVHSGAREWRWRDRPPLVTTAAVRPLSWALRLNRHPQREAVSTCVTKDLLVPGSPVRGAAFVALSGEHNYLGHLGRQLYDFMVDDERQRGRMLRVEVEVPAPEDLDLDPTIEPWNAQLRARLQFDARATLADALRVLLRRKSRLGREGREALVWFDFGGWPRDAGEVPSTMDWIEHCRTWTEVLRDVQGLRVGFFLGLEVDAERRADVRAALSDDDFYIENAGSCFTYRVLTELGPAGYRDVYELLRFDQQRRLSTEDQVKVAKAIVAEAKRAGGGYARYDLLVEVLKRWQAGDRSFLAATRGGPADKRRRRRL